MAEAGVIMPMIALALVIFDKCTQVTYSEICKRWFWCYYPCDKLPLRVLVDSGN